MTADDLAKAARAFQGTIDSWEEYGVSDEDAAKGILAAMQALGLVDDLSVEQITEAWAAQERTERQERADRESARRAAMTPEDREIEDLIKRQQSATRAALMDKVLTMTFSASPMFHLMKSTKGMFNG